MTTRTAKFWVSDASFRNIKNGEYFPTIKTMNEPNEIQISWQEPKKKVKAWRWVYSAFYGYHHHVTDKYYSSIEELKKHWAIREDKAQPLLWTEVEMEEE